MKKMSYEDAVSELEKIVSEIENPSAPLEAVMDNVKKAAELLEFCRKSLRESEENINKIVNNKQ